MMKLTNVELKLLATFLIFSLYFVQWYGWNEESHFALTRSIVNQGTFEIDTYANQTGDRSFFSNHYYSDKDPGLAIVASPIYFLWKSVYGLFPINFRQKYVGSTDHVTEFYGSVPIITITNRGFFTFTSMILVIFFTSGIFTALTALLIFRILKYFTKKQTYRVLLTITYFFGTIAFNYSLHFMDHATSTFFLFLSFFLLFKTKKVKKPFKHFLLSGLFLGFSVLVDKLSLVFLPFFLLYALYLNRKYYFIFLIFLTISGLPYILYNYTLLGNPFVFTSAYVDRGIFRQAYKQPALKTSKLLEASFFNLEEITKELQLTGYIDPYVMFRLLFYPYRGLFFYSPVLILAFIGLYYMLENYQVESFLIFFMLISVIAAISTRETWWGGYCFGSRYLLSMVPFLMIPLAVFVRKNGLKIFLPLLILSIFISFLSLEPAEEWAYNWNAMHVKTTWKYKQDTLQILANPLIDHYLPLFIKNGPRSGIFENLINGYISIDIRYPALSKGVDFPFNAFHVPFLCLVPIVGVFLIIWSDEVVSLKEKI